MADHLVEGRVAAAGVVDVDAHRELFLGGPDAAGDEPGLVRVFAGEFVGRPPGQLGRGLVQLEDVILQPELLERDGGAVEGVGLDDVGARFEVGAMNVLDHLGLGQHQGFGAVLDAVAVPGEPLASHILFAELIGVDERAHRTVEDHDPPRQDFLEPAARCQRFHLSPSAMDHQVGTNRFADVSKTGQKRSRGNRAGSETIKTKDN